MRLNGEGRESWLAIETSGHAALKENHFLDDGAFLVAKLLVETARLRKEGKVPGDLIAPLPRPLESKEFRLKIRSKEFKTYGERVLRELSALAKSQQGWSLEDPNFEGLRVNCTGDDEAGWFLLRMSLHDPVMPLNIESSREGGVDRIRLTMKALLSEFSGLDLSAM